MMKWGLALRACSRPGPTMPQLPGGQGPALPRAWGRFSSGLGCTFGVGADPPRAQGADFAFLFDLAPGRCLVEGCDRWGVATILASAASRHGGQQLPNCVGQPKMFNKQQRAPKHSTQAQARTKGCIFMIYC